MLKGPLGTLYFGLEVNLAVNGPAMLGSATKEGQPHESFVISIAGIAAHFGGLHSNFVSAYIRRGNCKEFGNRMGQTFRAWRIGYRISENDHGRLSCNH